MSIKIQGNGSSSLFVLVIISIISLCFISSFYNAIRLQDIVRMRESYAERVYAAEGVLNYAIAFASTHYDAIKIYAKTPAQVITIWFDDLMPMPASAPKHRPVVKKKITITYGHVTPPPRHIPLVGKATIIMQEGIVVIEAVVSRNETVLAALTCQVVKPHTSADLIVAGWRHDQSAS